MTKNKFKVLLFASIGLIVGFGIGSAFQNPTQYISFNLKNANTSNVSIVTHGAAPKLPMQIDFAGEPTPLKDLEVRERLDREIIINSFRHSSTVLLLKRAYQWTPLLKKILKEENIPEDFIYLSMAESDLSQVTSPSNASGFWQFLKPTAIQYGLIVNDEVDQRFDIQKSTYAACKYLKDSYNKLGSWTLAAAGYNMGMTGVAKQANEQESQNYYDLFLNTETSRYVFRILALKAIHLHPEDFGYMIASEDLYEPYQYREVLVSGAVDSWIKFAQQNGTSYKELRRHNPWIRSTSLKNINKNTFEVKIPL
ncbi:MAG: lytic transglycosylase domain-containing protein [Chitinophagales bacterium]|nr:lytic transglycosylase domain-containing protein [Chitinophagales bacterium]MCZ2393868.1 lytic transglycosylase domain-containing protein [Chitinophagales bacterium]